MSNEVVEERIVQMEFDNKDFEKNIEQSRKSLNLFQTGLSALTGAAAGIGAFAYQLKGVTFDPMNASLQMGVGQIAKFATIFTGVSNIADEVYRRITGMVSQLSTIQMADAGFQKYEEKTSSVQTIMAAVRKEGETEEEAMERVNKQMEKLNWFTDETSYSFTDMVNNIGKFTSQGMELDKSVTAMQGIATWAAKSGAGVQGASRAMYNLSQALGMGAVKLQDWKSIENANMATKEFKEQAMAAAKAAGTLVEKEGKLFAGNEEVNVQTFSKTLSEGWFTSDVLMNVLNTYGEYADLVHDAQKDGELASETMRRLAEEGKNAGYELGESAFKAAQEAKTFTEAIDATKDAMSTAFLNIFETIFGNYLEAKELWTDFAELLYDVFVTPLESIQKMADLWKQLEGTNKVFGIMEKTVAHVTELVEYLAEVWDYNFDFSIVRTILSYVDAIDKLSDKFGEWVAKLKSNKKIRENLDNFVTGLLQGIWLIDDIAEKLLNTVLKPIFSTIANDGPESISELLGSLGIFLQQLWKVYDESDVLDKVLSNISDILQFLIIQFKEIGKVAKKAFDEIFAKKIDSGQIESLVSPLETVKDILIELIGFVSHGIQNIIPATISIFGWIKRIAGQIVHFGEKIWPAIKNIIDLAKNLFGTLSDYIKGFFDKSEITNHAKNISEFVEKVKNSIMEFVSKFTKAEESVDGLSQKTPKPTFFEALAQSIGKAIQYVAKIVEDNEDAILKIRNVLLGGKGLDDFLLNVATAIGVLVESGFAFLALGIMFFGANGLINTAKNQLFGPKGFINKVISGVTTMVTPIQTVCAQLTTTIQNTGKEIMKTFRTMSTQTFVISVIKELGTALLKLAAALLIISIIPTDKLAASFGVLAGSIAVLAAAIVGIYEAIDKGNNTASRETAGKFGVSKTGNKTAESLAGISAFLIGLSTAVLMLTGALAIISTIDDPKKAIQGLVAIVAILAALVGTTWTMNTADGKKLIATGIGLIIVSKAIKNIAKAVKLISKIDKETALTSITLLALIFGGLASLIGIASTFKAGLKDIAGFAVISLMMEVITGVLVTMAGIMVLLQKQTDIDKNYKLLLQMAQFMLAMGALMLAVVGLSKMMETSGGLKANMTISAISSIMPTFAGAIATMSGAIVALAKIGDPEAVRSAAISLAIIMGAMSTILLGASFFAKGGLKSIVILSTSFVILSAGLLALVPVLKVISLMNIEQLGLAVLGLAGALGILLLAGALISTDKSGTFATGLLKFAAAVAVLGASALMASTGIWMIADGFEKVTNAIARLSEIGPTGLSNFKKILDAFIERVPDIFGSIGTGIAKLFIHAVSNRVMIAEAIINLVLALSQAISQAFPRIKATFKMVMNELLDFLKEFMPKVNSFLYDIVTDLNNYLLEILNRDVPRLNEHLAMATWDLFLRILELLNKGVPMLNKELAKEGMNLIFWVNELLKYLAATILQGTIDILTMVRDNIGEIISLTVQIANTLLFGLIEGLIVSVPLLYDKALELIDALLELFDKILDSDRWNDMVTKIETLLGKLVEAMNKWVQIESKANGLLYNVGKNLINGLAKGLIGAWADSISAPIRLIGNGIVSGFKKVFRIQSPSKVMEQIGGYITEGLGIGMEKGGEGLKTVVTDISSMVKTDFTNNFGSLGDMAGNLGKGLLDGLKSNWSGFDFGSLLGNFTNLNPTITPTLDLSTLQSQAGGINDLFANKQAYAISANGFATPDIGADSVTATNRMQEMMDKMTSYMSVQQYNANQKPDINVILEGDTKRFLKVAKIENNKQIKATGVGAV
jgi:oligoribonuclease (3'-5' exoribonuclease)